MNWLKGLFDSTPPYPPSDSPSSLAAELIEAEAMAAELDDYLLGDRLFRQIVVETPEGTRRPKMTLGGLWERLQHLQAAADLGPEDQKRLAAVLDAWDAARRFYPDQFKRKLRRELDSYLKNWQYYLEQRAGHPDRWDADYQAELKNRRRVGQVLRLLGPDAPYGLMDDLETLERQQNIEIPES
jgi:DNA helicase IV